MAGGEGAGRKRESGLGAVAPAKNRKDNAGLQTTRASLLPNNWSGASGPRMGADRVAAGSMAAASFTTSS